MKLGLVIGKVWATTKDQKLHSIRLSLLQPVDENLKAVGKPLVAADPLNTHDGDVVFWVGGAEATFPYESHQIPSDVTIVGLVDRLDQ